LLRFSFGHCFDQAEWHPRSEFAAIVEDLTQPLARLGRVRGLIEAKKLETFFRKSDPGHESEE